MSDLFYLDARQLERIQPYFPKPHGVPQVDDLRVISGIIHVLKRGLQWRDAPAEGPTAFTFIIGISQAKG